MSSSDQAGIEHPVQMQLKAYNDRDIDAFMRWWADDCQYYEFPARLLASGAAEIKERHVVRFKEPDLFSHLTARMSVANLVIDREVVTRNFPEGPGEIDVIAIYEIEHGKIAKAWFKMGTPRLRPPGAITMRAAAMEDADAVRSVTRKAYSKWVPVIGREPLPMTADYVAAVSRHRIDLLYLDGTLAALIEMVPESDHLLIENIAVLPEFQRKGLGSKLLAHAEQVAAALGHVEIRLYTNKLFAGNVTKYLNFGYRIDREEDFRGGVTVYMSKRIAN